MKSAVLIEAHFLPSIGYFSVLAEYEKILLERHEHFVKQTERNRCHILTSQGVMRLTVPLAGRHGKLTTGMVQVDTSSPWPSRFWRTITSAYMKAPYFEHYGDELRTELFSGGANLFDLNRRILSLCLAWLGWKVLIEETSGYVEQTPTGVVDMRNRILRGNGDESGRGYTPIPYQQVFGKTFVPHLSILDLVFCLGPGASSHIRHSRGELNI